MKEYLLSTDVLNRNTVKTDKDALAIKIIRLLIMKPGDNPLHPEMGCDVYGRYAYAMDYEISDLEEEIRNQLKLYLPNYQTIEVYVTLTSTGRELRITCNIDDDLFNFSTAEVADMEDDNDISLAEDEEMANEA